MTIWNKIPETLPPGDASRFSPIVWLALDDGRVVPGQCLHKKATATYKASVHSWFIEPTDGQRSQQYIGEPLAWMLIVPPLYPKTKDAAEATIRAIVRASAFEKHAKKGENIVSYVRRLKKWADLT